MPVLPNPMFRWVDGAEEVARLLNNLPGVECVRQGTTATVKDTRPEPQLVPLRTELLVRYRRGSELQFLFVVPQPFVSPADLKPAIAHALASPPTTNGRAPQGADQEESMSTAAEVYGDVAKWIPGAQRLAEQLAEIPGVQYVEQQEPTPATQESGPSTWKERSGNIEVIVTAAGQRQIITIAPKDRGALGRIRSGVTSLVQRGERNAEGSVLRRDDQPLDTPILDGRRIAMDFSPIPGAQEVAARIAVHPSVQYVRMHRFAERTDDLAPRIPTVSTRQNLVVVTFYAGIQEQELLASPKAGQDLPRLAKEIQALLATPATGERSPAPVVAPPPARAQTALSNTRPASPPAPPSQQRAVVTLTSKQAESYDYLLGLGPAEGDEFPLDGITTKLGRRFTDTSGSNRYTPLVGKGLIVDRDGRKFVRRVGYTTVESTSSGVRADPIPLRLPKSDRASQAARPSTDTNRPNDLQARSGVPTPATGGTTTRSPAPSTRPGQTQGPMASDSKPSPTADQPSSPSAASAHHQFFIERQTELEAAERLLTERDAHAAVLRALGWEIVSVEGEPLLRRRKR
ncbi:MAG: hypothetical protein HYY50_01665 [Candidatus Kerfeldbacteria bacterium]|nr:hypothetical protein [Candidatus Kerfeldbacteria bacterium]